MQILSIKNLNFAYGGEIVLKNVSLNYDSKDFLGIIGPNGGGKSTLLKLILGLYKSQSVNLSLSPAQIGYVPQGVQANENFPLCALELVLMGLLRGGGVGFYSKSDKAKAMQALEKVGLAEFAHRKINDLSGGQRQKAFIARALVSECALLIMDEPTASLDSKSSVGVFELLSALNKGGVGVIAVCHDTNLVLAYADKVAYLNKELILHENTKQKTTLIKHLSQSHQHFCAVEMSAQGCDCSVCEFKFGCENAQNLGQRVEI